MIVLGAAKNKVYGVVGLGRSGRAVVGCLLTSGAEVFAWDDAPAARDGLKKEFAAVTIAAVGEWDFSQLAGLVMSPGIMLSHPAVVAAKRHGVEVIGDIELLYRAQPKAQYIAITGTNGKSTTTTLIAHILKACGKRVEVGGNLGTAALALAPLQAGEFYVLELSSYQLDLVASTHFQTSLLLNISPDHLDHHGTMAHYIAAKGHIFDRQTKDDVAIIGVDDAASEAICHRMMAQKNVRVIPISVTREMPQGIEVVDGMLQNRLSGEQGDLRRIKSLQGAHNWQNAAAAYAACVVSGCAHDAILAAMKTYPGLAHRMEWLGEIAGVQFVNDSKATNADAAEKALKTYDGIYWIAGGVAKEGGIASLTNYFPKIRHAYLIGEAAKDFAATLEGKVKYSLCGTLEKAFAQAAADAAKAGGGAVVLSPACASFDQYPNFEKRGEAFVRLFELWKQQT